MIRNKQQRGALSLRIPLCQKAYIIKAEWVEPWFYSQETGGYVLWWSFFQQSCLFIYIDFLVVCVHATQFFVKLRKKKLLVNINSLLG